MEKNVFKYYNKFMLKIIEGNISCKAVLEEQKRKCEILYVDKKKRTKDRIAFLTEMQPSAKSIGAITTIANIPSTPNIKKVHPIASNFNNQYICQAEIIYSSECYFTTASVSVIASQMWTGISLNVISGRDVI